VVIRDVNSRRIEGMALVEASPDEELELVSRDGPSRWIAVLSSPVQGAQEKAWVVLVRDVTAEHLVEEAKSDFLSTISHELRTPLTAIKGSLSMLQKARAKGSDDETFERLLGVMGKGTGRLERLVMNLLFVSQVDESETPKVRTEDVDLLKVLKERAGAVLGGHPVTYDFDAEESVPVRVDRERLGQIIEHLLENAVKFDPNGETVVEIAQEAGFARFTVRDQGPGIPLADQERVFERFVRLGDVLTRQTQGPGVGLFIVKRSVEAMGGKVWVESKPGGGAAFHVTFPLARPMVIEGDSA
jgi:signal transduction histidine kinase